MNIIKACLNLVVFIITLSLLTLATPVMVVANVAASTLLVTMESSLKGDYSNFRQRLSKQLNESLTNLSKAVSKVESKIIA